MAVDRAALARIDYEDNRATQRYNRDVARITSRSQERIAMFQTLAQAFSTGAANYYNERRAERQFNATQDQSARQFRLEEERFRHQKSRDTIADAAAAQMNRLDLITKQDSALQTLRNSRATQLFDPDLQNMATYTAEIKAGNFDHVAEFGDIRRRVAQGLVVEDAPLGFDATGNIVTGSGPIRLAPEQRRSFDQMTTEAYSGELALANGKSVSARTALSILENVNHPSGGYAVYALSQTAGAATRGQASEIVGIVNSEDPVAARQAVLANPEHAALLPPAWRNLPNSSLKALSAEYRNQIGEVKSVEAMSVEERKAFATVTDGTPAKQWVQKNRALRYVTDGEQVALPDALWAPANVARSQVIYANQAQDGNARGLADLITSTFSAEDTSELGEPAQAAVRKKVADALVSQKLSTTFGEVTGQEAVTILRNPQDPMYRSVVDALAGISGKPTKDVIHETTVKLTTPDVDKRALAAVSNRVGWRIEIPESDASLPGAELRSKLLELRERAQAKTRARARVIPDRAETVGGRVAQGALAVVTGGVYPSYVSARDNAMLTDYAAFNPVETQRIARSSEDAFIIGVVKRYAVESVMASSLDESARLREIAERLYQVQRPGGPGIASLFSGDDAAIYRRATAQQEKGRKQADLWDARARELPNLASREGGATTNAVGRSWDARKNNVDAGTKPR